MYLKKLTLQGFKSFATRTEFEFGRGVTSVVGPNGSGKSNVADGIRWVLGEQSVRLLRARKQEDVIFAGAGGRAAVGMAEVLLTLDNEDRWLPLDFSEIQVGRRVYRNGESEYLLNGARVRLREVVDLLMKGDVGQNSYAIMGQGLVDEVLSMSPDERRSFLDEAADVKRFRARIKEAQDRLASTRENMARVDLLVGEIEPRLAQLSRQAERAAEHARLSAELAELLRVYYGHRWSEAQNALVRARAGLDQSAAENGTAAARVGNLRDQIRALSDEIRKRRDALARRDARQAEAGQQLRSLEHALALDRERLAMTASRREEIAAEAAALEAERDALAPSTTGDGERTAAIAEEIAAATAFARECRAALDAAERDHSTARGRLQELRDAAAADERRAGALQADGEAARRRIAQLEREDSQAEARRRQALLELVGYGRRFRDLRERAAAAEERLEGARLAVASARERAASVQEELRAYEEASHQDLRDLDHLEGRLDALRRIQVENDGVAAGTRNVLAMGHALPAAGGGAPAGPADVPGVIGLLSRQMRVPPGLETAINAALEQRLHAVVVEREDQALLAIELLNRRRHGRAQFLALDGVRHVYPLNLQKEKGVVGVAAKLVRCENAFRPLVDTILGRVIVVEDIPTAQRMIRRALGSVVTLDGTYIEPTGVITGGATGIDESTFSRQNELDELPARIEELRARTAVAAGQLENGRRTVQQLAAAVHSAEEAHQGIRRELDAARHELERERDRLHRLRREMDAVGARRQSVAADRAAAEKLIAQSALALEQAQARRGERSATLAAAEEELRTATAARDRALEATATASAKVATIEGERRTLQAMREQQAKAVERLVAQAAARRQQANNLEAEAAAIETRLAAHTAQLEEARAASARSADDAAPDRDELHRLESHERARQDELAEAQAALLAVERRRLDCEAEVARSEELLRTLRNDMEREGLAPGPSGAVVPLEEAYAGDESPAPTPAIQGAANIDPEAVRLRIEEIRRHIRRLGTINEEAPEDFRDSQARYEFLTGQARDLNDAEAQLRAAIADLNEEVRSRFAVTFDKVNTAFGEYFTAFFGGGEARLLLTSAENPAEAGIEIEAQPPGKRINSLSLLSGGERSLTAVALLFALLSANPAPFCVLDEVDAALDEANVGRFTAALAKLAERTQFLVVTHNRKTVEMADAIYGVSMGRDGVSKVLSLRLSDVRAD